MTVTPWLKGVARTDPLCCKQRHYAAFTFLRCVDQEVGTQWPSRPSPHMPAVCMKLEPAVWNQTNGSREVVVISCQVRFVLLISAR